VHVDPRGKVLGEYRNPLREGRKVETDDRWHIYDYMLQEAILKDLLFANSPPNTDVHDYIPALHLSPSYPPTYIVHGDIDDKSGFEQSISFVEASKLTGVEVILERRQGVNHLFDYLEGADLSKMFDWFLEKVTRSD